MPNKWFAAFLGFFLQPFAFLYLSKIKWFFIYLVLAFLIGGLDYYLDMKLGYSGVVIFLALVSAIHAFKLAKVTQFSSNRHWYNRWWGILLIPIAFISFAFSIRAFLYEPFHAPSTSMSPTLNVDDHILVSKWGYGNYESYGITLYKTKIDEKLKPKRGEIFIFYPPHDRRHFIKRIIGLPGDTIQFSNRQLIINGENVKTESESKLQYQEYLGGHSYTVQYRDGAYNSSIKKLHEFTISVPSDSYFVMGDNRDNSLDSRAWGFVPAENIVGKMILKW